MLFCHWDSVVVTRLERRKQMQEMKGRVSCKEVFMVLRQAGGAR